MIGGREWCGAGFTGCAFGAVDVEAGVCGGGSAYSTHFNLASWKPDPAALPILQVLKKTGWRIEGRNGAAGILGLNPSTLRARMRKFGIIRQ